MRMYVQRDIYIYIGDTIVNITSGLTLRSQHTDVFSLLLIVFSSCTLSSHIAYATNIGKFGAKLKNSKVKQVSGSLRLLLYFDS